MLVPPPAIAEQTDEARTHQHPGIQFEDRIRCRGKIDDAALRLEDMPTVELHLLFEGLLETEVLVKASDR